MAGMAGIVAGGMVLGFLGLFVAATAAVVSKDAWMLLIFPGSIILGSALGFIIALIERRPGS